MLFVVALKQREKKVEDRNEPDTADDGEHVAQYLKRNIYMCDIGFIK